MSNRKDYLNAGDFRRGQLNYYYSSLSNFLTLQCTNYITRLLLIRYHLFGIGLEVLETEIGKDLWLTAFAPFTFIAAGGFFAVSYFKSRESTGDLDYLLKSQ